ncbi:putative membrane protein [Propionispora sp. 2/2-37]|uniref:hypothetical protein n=1 Tax=Propionispora sp. 2/2-37 TaxID=1677858 RepID=UPI0006C64302|nr:hypothetical protein [Propionispora sp. 2/2-37]CUH96820.1 putative membrane protein [Propionispora sp. 2/2-37]
MLNLPLRMVPQSRVQWITEVGLLAAFIAITGTFKLPGLIPGTEFQLSAPLAVAICAVFGFTKYLTAGMLASLAGLVLGTQSVIHVGIAIVFRVVAGLVILVAGRSLPAVVAAGPLGSLAARLVLGYILDQAAWPLVMAALPGMLFTAATAWPLTGLLSRIKERKE